MAISNMQQPRQMYNQGGLGALDAPRQGYFLGKLVKKATRAVKKVVKSPLGKMALLGTAANFAPMLFGKGTLLSQAGGLGGLKSKFLSGKGFLGGVGNMFGKEGDITKGLSMGRVGLGALGAASLAPLFMGGDNDEVEEQVTQLDPIGTVQSARNYYSGLGDKGVGLNFMPKKKYVSQNFYAADGGRAGYANGQLVTPSGDGSRPGYAGDRFLMPENAPPRNKKFDFMFETGPITDRNLEILKNMTEEERRLFEEQGSPFDIIEKFIDIPFQIRGEEIIKEKYAQGGRANFAMGGDTDDEDEKVRMQASQFRRQPMAFLAMGGDAGNAQAEQMLMAEFVKYKNKGGDLSFEQFVKAVMQQQEQSQGMEQPTMMAANGGPVPDSTVPGYTTPAGYNKFDYRSGGVRVGKADGGQLVSPSNDGSRPGYAGDDGILSTIKNFPKNLKSGLEQIFSGEVGATLGGDQKSINEFMVGDMWGQTLPKETIDMIIDANKKGVDVETIISLTGADASDVTGVIDMLNMNIEQKAYGGRIGKAEGGIMDTEEASEMIDMGGMEKDYREEGGFVAMGGEERADDVPARLSKNEFVFTADAVRNAGGGDIDRGSEVMQNLMDNLEQGGQVSEDSQGLGGEEMMMSEEMIEEPDGAQAMYEQQQALQSRMI